MTCNLLLPDNLLNNTWVVTEDLFLQLEQYTCQMYRKKSMFMEKCGEADKKLDAKKIFDLSSLPPPEVCLREHVKRVNYQVAI